MTLSASEVHRLKQAPTLDGVLPVIHQRWSPRSFADRDVLSSDLKKIFDAARWAPSSYNEQPWRFLVGRRGSETYDKILAALGEFNRKWAVAAPVLILGVAGVRFSHNQQTNHYAVHDLGAAAAFITLQAAALGLATHQMAGYDQGAARKSFAIPEDFALGSVIALGYQGEPAALGDDSLIQTETSPRQRKDFSQFVFSSWDQPLDLG